MAVIYSNRSDARSARKASGARHQYRFAGDDTSVVVAKAYYVSTAEDGSKRRVPVKDLAKATRMQIRFVREDGVVAVFWVSALVVAAVWCSGTDEFLLSGGETKKLEAVDADSGEVGVELREFSHSPLWARLHSGSFPICKST